MRATLTFLIITGVCILFICALPENKKNTPEVQGLEWFKREAPVFVKSVQLLRESLTHIQKNDVASLNQAKLTLKKCRLQYKRIAYLLEYYFPYEASICNGPPVVDPEEDEVTEPLGLQVMESWLFEPDPSSHLQDYVRQTDLMEKAIQNVLPLIDNFKTNDAAFLQSLNLELIRIIALYLAGFDAPKLKTGIEEAYQSFSAIEVALEPFCNNEDQKSKVQYYFTKGKGFLRSDSNFNSFDRLYFLTRFALPIQRILNELLNKASGTQIIYTGFNNKAKDLFSADVFNKEAFPHSGGIDDSIVMELGKLLFFEKALSKNYSRSCASCHVPKSYFMDGLARNQTLDGADKLLRNTPSLYYSCFQFAQFWDGRVSSIEGQVSAVLKNQNEMGATEEIIVKRLQSHPKYIAAFRKAWPSNPQITLVHIASALGAYVRSLSPFKSAFDDYMNGNFRALSSSQKRGFNLFMGKAGCGTCHFAPVFNGLLPPTYTNTEYEVTGMTASGNLNSPVLDSDLGRYNVVSVPSYKGAFKTPTVRNAAVTAPYMHNGAFGTLETLVDFYDKGGGQGLGLQVPEQSLSSTPLHLTQEEKKDLIAFIESLTDKGVKN